VELYNCGGAGYTSGAPFEVPAGTTDAVFRNNVRESAGSPGGASYTAGTNIDLTGNVISVKAATPTGTTLVFTQDADYAPIYSGSFNVDPTGAVVGKVVFVELAAAASQPTLDPAMFELTAGSYASGKRNEYGFRVAASGNIHYVINQLP
jgi:hypothetical protein